MAKWKPEWIADAKDIVYEKWRAEYADRETESDTGHAGEVFKEPQEVTVSHRLVIRRLFTNRMAS